MRVPFYLRKGAAAMQYKTQMEAAKKGIVTEQMRIVAEKEYMEPEKLRGLVACGQGRHSGEYWS